MERNQSPQGGDEAHRTTHEHPAVAPFELEPDAEDLAQLIVAVEQKLDHDGWDQPPRVFTLHQTADGGIDVHGLLAPPHAVYLPALLEAAAVELRSSASADRLRSRFSAGYFGLLISSEAWARVGPQALTTDATRSLADQVGSVECRLLTLRTVGGQELTYQHVRGRESGFLPADVQAGRMIDAMRYLADTIQALRTRRDPPPRPR